MKLVIFTEEEMIKNNMEDYLEFATSIVDIDSLREQAVEDFLYGSKVGNITESELGEIQTDDYIEEFLKSIADADNFTLSRIVHDAYQDSILEKMVK